jgi:hypothetical protein
MMAVVSPMTKGVAKKSAPPYIATPLTEITTMPRPSAIGAMRPSRALFRPGGTGPISESGGASRFWRNGPSCTGRHVSSFFVEGTAAKKSIVR